ncbi:MAG: Tetratricopeptide 1 repeat-containing protein [Gemmatimonadetes bacterium]|nr:Tetratricopeptide 1 repeat-containing protein [Gemmatimonadota bacterium]
MMRHHLRAALVLLAAIPAGAFSRPVAAQQEANPVNLFVADLRYVHGVLSLGPPRKLTHDVGRNSQPSFTPDGRAVLFAAQREGGQVDVYRTDLATGVETQVTHTAENENSPTVQPDGRIMVIRWKPETLFREWGPYLYKPDGTADQPVLPGPDTVGYFARADAHTFAFMRPASRFRVALWDDRVKTMVDVDSPVAGLPPQRVPGARAVSYTRTDSAGRNVIRRVELDSRRTSDVAPTLLGRTSHAWTARGVLLMGRGNAIYAMDPARGRTWRRLAAFQRGDLRNVTAYAVSSQGTRLVFYSTLKVPLHVVLRDSLQAGRGALEAVALVRRMASENRAAYEVSEGGITSVGTDWLAMGKAAEAVEVLSLAAELFPRSPDAQAQLADAYRKLGRNDAAAEHYRRALALNPRTTEAEKAAAAQVEKALAETVTVH